VPLFFSVVSKFVCNMSRSTSPVRVNIMSDSDGEEMNSEHVLNDLSTKIVNDVLPPEKESDLAINKNSVVAEVEHDTEDISKKAQQTLENLKDQAGDIMNNLRDITREVGSHENSPSHGVVEGLKAMAEEAQEKADEVSEWAKEKVEEVKSSFEQHPDAPKEKDNTIIGDLKEAAGKAQQKFEEVVVQSEKLINEHDSSPAGGDHHSESFKVERVLDSPLKAETDVPNVQADPFTTIKDDDNDVHHFEKHDHESHESEISFVGNDSAEASSDIREHRPSPEDITADEKHGEHIELPVINDPIEAISSTVMSESVPVVIDEDAPEVPARSLSPHGEHLAVGEDDHKFHDEEHTEATPVHEEESKEEIPLETYEEPSPQRETTPPVLADNVKEDITNVTDPKTTVAFDGHHGDGTEGYSQDIHISDVVEQALHDKSPIQIESDEPLPLPNTNAPGSMTENIPAQIVIEDVDAKGHDDDLKLDITQEDEHQQEPQSPPQLASQEHSPQQKSDDVSLERTKRSIEEYPKEPSPPVDAIHDFAKDVEKESSPPALEERSHTEALGGNIISSIAHKKDSPPPVPKITTKPPTPPSSPIEDKAEEEVIVPKIVVPETKEEKEKSTVTTKTTTTTHEESYHVKPIDLTPLPEDEPIPVGIPEVKHIETVKEEKAKKDKKGSTSSEDDKDKTATTRRQEGGIVGNIRRRCTIL
jgi:hypothetical protein